MTHAFLDLIDLAGERMGGAVVAANDDFFAPKERLIAPEAPIWREGEYTDRGKWMDGWETRRRRDPGHDWCVIRLGVRGIVHGFDVDTTHFNGNFPESCAIDVADLPAAAAIEDAAWHELVPRTTLSGDAHNLFTVDAAPPANSVRLRIFPDGGVARLRAYGEAIADWDALRRRGHVDLAAAEHGGIVIACSDMFFGSRHNLIMPGDAVNMGDGWETRRRRGPGHDWTIVRLAHAGTIERMEVDTRHFKGNAPGACSLEGASCELSTKPGDWTDWKELLVRTPLRPDARHAFDGLSSEVVTHVRFNIFPDGGVGRLRLFGTPR
jgi:allantoicase